MRVFSYVCADMFAFIPACVLSCVCCQMSGAMCVCVLVPCDLTCVVSYVCSLSLSHMCALMCFLPYGHMRALTCVHSLHWGAKSCAS